MATDQYSDKKEHYFQSQRKEMIPFIPNNVQTLLEVGCGTGSFASHLKGLRQIEVTGIEPQRNAYEQASKVLDRVLQLDVDSGMTELHGKQFDCICGDWLAPVAGSGLRNGRPTDARSNCGRRARCA